VGAGHDDDAIRQLQDELKKNPRMDREKKALLYSLGELYQKLGRDEEAIMQFKAIYETDIGFRDVATKVDAYWEAKH
jgi:tetratricopeptide (TPR) repeat protein